MSSFEMKQAVIGTTMLEIVVGNIVREETQAIINPAQTSLFPGGGVDGEIHLWGGTQIWQECRALDGCQTGDAKLTTGGDLPAEYIIHTVGPIWSGGSNGEAAALALCYRRCLEVAQANDIRSIAFPAISTGHYGYPIQEAAEIALGTVISLLKINNHFALIRFVLKGRQAFEAHCVALEHLI